MSTISLKSNDIVIVNSNLLTLRFCARYRY